MTSFMRSWNQGFSGYTSRGRKSRRRQPQARLRHPVLEPLDSRLLLAVDITAFNTAAGTVTFTGDSGGMTADHLVLSEVMDNGVSYLSHDLVGNGGVGDYADSTDIDPNPGPAVRLAIGSGTSPL